MAASLQLAVINPATGRQIASVPADTALTVGRKFEAARAAQSSWAATSLRHRLECLRRFRERIVSRTDELALTLTRETGKPVTQSRNELRGFLPRIDFS